MPPTRADQIRVAIAGGLPLVLTAFMLSPWSEPEVRHVEGYPSAHEFCSLHVLCSRQIAIDATLITCAASVLGVSQKCRDSYSSAAKAKASYFVSPTLLSLLGIQPPDNVLLGLEQDGKAIHSYTVHRHLWRAFYGGWYLYAASGAIAFAVARLKKKSKP